ncbi:MAG: phosphoribosylanthranilate isomerase [Eubacterium sp.]|nr:phosphoribosylanthranilate isomerase [Eubacterium sp.]
MKIKICGIRREEDVRYLNETMPDYAGFIFADTKRIVTEEQAALLRKQLDPQIQVFGVFVNAPVEQVSVLACKGIINVIQLHGDETEGYIRTLRSKTEVPVIKAVRVKKQEDILLADQLPVDHLLLDTYHKGQYGGTGETFSWELIPKDLEHSYLLAGGIRAGNICQALSAVEGKGRCIGVDVSGGVETNGVKDKEKIKKLIETVRTYRTQ